MGIDANEFLNRRQEEREKPIAPPTQKGNDTAADEEKICSRCGESAPVKQFHKTHWGVSSVCLKCSKAKRRQKKVDKIAEVARMTSGSALYLDFTGKEDLLQRIVDIAAAEERTANGQILYWLKKQASAA